METIVFEGKFRKKPVVIEAHIFDGSEFSAEAVWRWSKGNVSPNTDPAGIFIGGMRITTLEGTMTVSAGDWVIRGVKGEYYPCKPDIFETTYEPEAEEDYVPKTEAEVDAILREADYDPEQVGRMGVKVALAAADQSPLNPKNVKIAQLEAEIANLMSPDKMVVTKMAWDRKQNQVKELEESLFNLHEELSKRNYACGQALDELYRNITHSSLPWEYPAQAQREIMQVVDQLRPKES